MSRIPSTVPDPAPLGPLRADGPTVAPETESEEQQRLRQIEKNQAAIQLLMSWLEGDENEQRETLEYLMGALDENRPADQKLFL